MGLLIVEELDKGPQPLRVRIVQLRQLRDILVNVRHSAHVEYLLTAKENIIRQVLRLGEQNKVPAAGVWKILAVLDNRTCKVNVEFNQNKSVTN